MQSFDLKTIVFIYKLSYNHLLKLFQVLDNINDIADTLGLKYSKKPRDLNPIEYYSDSETE